MLGARDLCWSLGICATLILFSQCRPTWNARRFVERESRAGFAQVFAGHRFASGELVGTGDGTHVDPMAEAVVHRSLEIKAERLDWRGERAEFVLRHAVQLSGGDASHDIHLRLERRGGRWVYTLFEVRGRPPLGDPDRENPFARALRAGQAEPG